MYFMAENDTDKNRSRLYFLDNDTDKKMPTCLLFYGVVEISVSFIYEM